MDILALNIKMLNKFKKIYNDDNEEIRDIINYLNINNIKYTLEIKNNGFLILLAN